MQSFEEFKKNIKRVAKSHIAYFDEEGNLTYKENATRCIITEYDSDGKLIKSTHGICKPKNNK